MPEVRMEGVEYTQVRLSPPFQVRAPLGEDWRLYLIRGGEVVFEASNAARTRVRLAPGSVVALSGVLQHRFLSVTGQGDAPPHAEWGEEAVSVAAPAGIVITIGRVAKSRLTFLALFDRLIAIRADEHPETAGRIAAAIDAIAQERRRPGPESDMIIRKFAEITALEIGRFRRTMLGPQDQSTHRAQSDPRILRAISAFYAAPQEKWSLERLAEAAGMSRTAFAVRYRELIGATPLRSVRQLRMQIAAEQLARFGAPHLRTMASHVGYGSETAFIRAFAKEFGVTPGAARRKPLQAN